MYKLQSTCIMWFHNKIMEIKIVDFSVQGDKTIFSFSIILNLNN